MGVLAVPLMIAGTVLSAASAYKSGQDAKQSARFEAQQLESSAQQKRVMAIQEQAVAQRRAIAEGKASELKMSTAQNISAASGGGALDTSVLNIMADLAGSGDYRKRVALYEGDVKAQNLNYSADMDIYGAEAKRKEGKAAARAGTIGAVTSLAMGLGAVGSSSAGQSFFAKYSGGSAATTAGATSGGFTYGGALDSMPR